MKDKVEITLVNLYENQYEFLAKQRKKHKPAHIWIETEEYLKTNEVELKKIVMAVWNITDKTGFIQGCEKIITIAGTNFLVYFTFEENNVLYIDKVKVLNQNQLMRERILQQERKAILN